MARRLLIPGTGGATFTSHDGTQMGSIVDLLKGDARHLRCEHANAAALAPTQTSGEVDAAGQSVGLTATGYLRAAYDPFTAGQPSYLVWPFDWRLDIRYSAQQLADWFASPAGQGDWDVVCHSQGGLVLLAALKLIEGAGRDPRKSVRRLAMVAVPLFGTMNSAAAILSGVSVGGTVPVAIVRTWPSVHQMLPLFDAGMPGPAPQLYRDQAWVTANLMPPPPPGAPDLSRFIDPAMLGRARAWQTLRASRFFEPLRGLDGVFFLFGKNLPTRERAPAFPTLPSVAAINPPDVVRGDSLVATDVTWALLPDWVQHHASAHSLNVSEHMFMCNDIPVYQECESFFSR